MTEIQARLRALNLPTRMPSDPPPTPPPDPGPERSPLYDTNGDPVLWSPQDTLAARVAPVYAAARAANQFTMLPSGVRVSTVFLFVDHGFVADDVLLWETLVFVDTTWRPAFQAQYATYPAAVAGHAAVVAALSSPVTE